MQNAVAAHPRGPRPVVAHPRRRSAHSRARRVGALEISVILLVGAVLALTLVWQISARDVRAVEDTAVISVAPSDTLWEIARAYPVDGLNTAETVRVIVAINEMDDSSLVAGQSLLVPASATSEASVALR